MRLSKRSELNLTTFFRRILMSFNVMNFFSLRTLSNVYEQALKKSYEGYALCKIKYKNGMPSDLLFLNEHEIFSQILGLHNITGKYASEILPGSLKKILAIFNAFIFDQPYYQSINKELFSRQSQRWFSYHILQIKRGYYFIVIEDISKRKETEFTLEKAYNMLNSIIEATGDGILVISKDSKIVKYNEQFLSVNNIPEDALMKMSIFELINSVSKNVKDPDQFLEEIHKISLHPETPAESLVEFSDGRIYLRHIKPQILNGEIIGRVFCFKDLTELIRSEEQIKTLFRKLKFHLDNTPLAIIETDQNNRIIEWSKTALDIFGWMEHEVFGKRYDEFPFFYEPDLLDAGIDAKKIQLADIKYINKIRNYDRDGNLIWCEWFNSSEVDSDGKVVSVLSIVKDITEKIVADEEIQRNHQFLDQIINGSREGLAVIDRDFNIKIWNPYMEKLKGKSREEVLGKNLLEEFTYYQRNGFYESFMKALNGQLSTLEINLPTGKTLNMPVWTEEKIIPFVDISNEIIGTILIVNDITKIKSSEQELSIRLNKLTELNTKLADYKFARQELDQFASLSSHQLQAPIRTIKNYIKVIKEDFYELINGPINAYLDTIFESAGRMSSLIEVLSDYSQTGSRSRIEKCNTKDLINSTISDLSYMIESSGAIVNVNDLPVIYAYPVEFRQLILNLLTNAIKFQKKGKKPIVNISAKLSDDNWVFSVQDNGIGIPNIHSHKLFEIFQRLHPDEYEGKGIGLAYSKKIVNLHKGEIWFESRENLGTTFYFSIGKLN